LHINPDDAGRNSPFWRRISRAEALCAESTGAFVAVSGSGIHGAALKFEPGCPYYLASGPYRFASLQYFVYAGPIGATALSRSGGGGASKPSRAPATAQAEAALEPESAAGADSERTGLFNLEWFKSAEGKEETLDHAEPGSQVGLRIESEGLMPGDIIRFLLTRESDGKTQAELTGSLGDGRSADSAAVTWVVKSPAGSPPLAEGDRVLARAFHRSKGLECRSTPLTLGAPRHLGGVKVRFTDFLGRTPAGVKARLRHEQTWLDQGELRDGLLHLNQLPHGAVEAEVEWEECRILLPVAWQRPPLVEETIPLFKLMEKTPA
jgi:hypothetical protein